MVKGYKFIFWSYLLTSCFNIGHLGCFIAYSVIFIGINLIKKVRNSHNQNKSLITASCLAIINGLYYLINLVMSYFIDTSVITVYFSYLEVPAYTISQLNYTLILAVWTCKILMIYFILCGSINWIDSVGLKSQAQQYTEKKRPFLISSSVILMLLIIAPKFISFLLLIIIAIANLGINLWFLSTIHSLKKLSQINLTLKATEFVQESGFPVSEEFAKRVDVLTDPNQNQSEE